MRHGILRRSVLAVCWRAAALTAIWLVWSAAGATGAKTPITAEQAAKDEAEWIGLIPDALGWAPDGSRFYYHAGNYKARRPDENAVFEVGKDGGKPRRLSEEERLKLPPIGSLLPRDDRRNFSRDGRFLVYAKDGDVFLLNSGSGQTIRITNTDARESNPHFSHDDRYVLYESGQNLYGWAVGTGEVRQFTAFRAGTDPDRKPQGEFQKFLEQQQAQLFGAVREQESENASQKKQDAAELGRPTEPHWLAADQTVSQLELSPDGRWVTFLMAEKPGQAREAAFQRMVTPSGFPELAPARAKAGDPPVSVRIGVYGVADGKVKWVDVAPFRRPVTPSGPWWSPDGKQAVIKILSQDFKDLWVEELDCETGKTRVLFQDHDDAWIPAYPAAAVRWMRDSRSIYLTSERGGYRQLYTVDLEGNIRQRTNGAFDLSMDEPAPMLSKDGKRWYFHANIEDPAEENFYALATEGSPEENQPVRLTPRHGVQRAFLSPDEKRIAMLRSTPDMPTEVYLEDNPALEDGTSSRDGAGSEMAEARRISHSTTPEFEAVDWVAPQFLKFRDEQGIEIPARLYEPRKQDSFKRALIQIHGSGYTQIVRRRMDTDYLHTYQQYLVGRGYTILEIDYRGSAGYGRDFRTAIYRHMGGEDLASAMAAAEYLVRERGIDRRRIGIFGRSYGGFLTLMALFTRPGVFAAGAAMAPVSDWAHYEHSYAGKILNMPQEDDESFRRSSPIYFAQNLRAPLLILHGMVDSNVLYQDSVRLSQRLIELKKTGWQLVSYPVEDHVLATEESKLDCLRRISDFFDAALTKP